MHIDLLPRVVDGKNGQRILSKYHNAQDGCMVAMKPLHVQGGRLGKCGAPGCAA